ncbi:CHASE2 domain-containing protein [Flaviaesturariibacter aridisoli]|uniref:CHASE2 domain-containing protein n=1 Tax=Flaviaesturariibacter aridisoli TaxID=2545761 RepID=A0A4R4E507_9BACT|nr:CHASE2 domain-containing protein [Flaviaesturariibacter aridisoli]TCZ74067.1 CHASE2 domain-containing protein [Flaviaesturariibacter aridisoli]
MFNPKRLPLKIVVCVTHAILLVVITIMLQYVGKTRFDEIAFFKAFAITKHNIFRIDNKPVKDSICCLDVSKDQVMVDDTGMNYGRVPITNRQMLAKFFTILNQHKGKYKTVLCDIAFTIPSPDDTSLKAPFEQAGNVFTFLSIHNGKPDKPLFSGRYGAADYTVNGGDFVKYPLFYNDTLRSLPLVMMDTADDKFYHDHLLTYEKNQIAFNTFIPEFYYRNQDLHTINKGDKYANLFYMGEVIDRPDFFENCVKDKYVLVGDFDNDKHPTYLGEISGTLILFDAYLTLRTHNLAISYIWLALLFLIYTIISYFLFYAPEKGVVKIAEKVKISFIKEFLTKYISYLGLLIGINLVSFYFFGIFISLFYLATYLTFVRTIIKKIIVYKRDKSFIAIFSE